MGTITLDPPPAVTPRGAQRPSAAVGPRPSVEAADISALEQVLRDEQVTFNDVARAWFHLCDDELPEEQRARCERLYPELLSAFSEPRGGVVTAYFCRHVRVAAALTDIHRAAAASESLSKAADDEDGGDRMAASSSALHIECAFGDPTDPHARALLFNCLDLHYRAIEFLMPKPRKICLRMIMGVVTALLGILDERRCGGQPECLEAREVQCLENVIEQARRYYDRSAQRQAQIEYFIGMAGGLTLLFAVLALLVKVPDRWYDTDAVLLTPLAGGIGAFVSVLARMTRGQLRCSYESGRTIMRLLGLIRPLLGAIFGAAIYVLLMGGLLTLEPPKGKSELFFFVGIAFIAGFSERFAQDMVARAPGAVSGAPAPAESPARAPAHDRATAHDELARG